MFPDHIKTHNGLAVHFPNEKHQIGLTESEISYLTQPPKMWSLAFEQMHFTALQPADGYIHSSEEPSGTRLHYKESMFSDMPGSRFKFGPSHFKNTRVYPAIVFKHYPEHDAFKLIVFHVIKRQFDTMEVQVARVDNRSMFNGIQLFKRNKEVKSAHVFYNTLPNGHVETGTIKFTKKHTVLSEPEMFPFEL